jgi:hypothetical protein
LIGTEERTKFQCPVCHARFRNSRTCLRCGADLAPLLLLIDQAYQLRQQAKWALERGYVERAVEVAAEAENLCSAQNGHELWLLSSWLLNGFHNELPRSALQQAVTREQVPTLIADRPAQLVPVRFTAKNPTVNQGDRIFLTGNTAELGNWTEPSPPFDKAAEATIDPSYPNWSLRVSVPAGQTIQFKFIKIAADGTVTWEEGNNHTYTVPTSGEGSVNVNWQY